MDHLRKEDYKATICYCLDLLDNPNYQTETARQAINQLMQYCQDQFSIKNKLTNSEREHLKTSRSKLSTIRLLKQRTGCSFVEGKKIIEDYMMESYGYTSFHNN